jgi:chaperonin GroEL
LAGYCAACPKSQRQIAKNAGVEVGEVIADQGHKENGIWVQRKDRYLRNLMSTGHRSAKVVRVGLQNAGSIAGMILSTEVPLRFRRGER